MIIEVQEKTDAMHERILEKKESRSLEGEQKML
jgi:hypothetical protein